MDSSDTDSDVPPASPAPKTKRPVPVKALEALAKARQMKAEKKMAEVEAKKAKKEERKQAVEVVDKARNEIVAPPVAPAAQPDLSYLRSLEEKIELLAKKAIKPKKKKVVVEDSDSSSEEEVIIRKKKPAKVVKVVEEDPTLKAYKEHQVKALERERVADEKKAERERLRSLFSR
jgi:hypothetical protein